MKTPKSRFSRIIMSLMLLIVIAGIIAYLVLPRPEQRQIVLMGGALLILNLVLMQFFLGKNL
ncbi:hypothetical protein [Porphyromonas loveana]|uniref:Uncharacterized protein n=1 Tax=Porphyromonas loveana TaxID=1884669 RepID=A0A2U1F163_9PORP|nr:hypothetical protein [Porphyromonas loveana]PVZ05911.1 hypothetical protein C7382_12418 [Porphyromonas loveana]